MSAKADATEPLFTPVQGILNLEVRFIYRERDSCHNFPAFKRPVEDEIEKCDQSFVTGDGIVKDQA